VLLPSESKSSEDITYPINFGYAVVTFGSCATFDKTEAERTAKRERSEENRIYPML
jgi:hypothetical protein